MKRLRVGLILAALVGAFGGTVLVGYFGLEEVGEAFLMAGWNGLAAVALFHLLPITVCAYSWYVLMPREHRIGFAAVLRARWIREGVQSLLGVLPIAGEVIGARLIALGGVPGVTSAAVIVIDMTAEALSQAVFTLLGIALLVLYRPDDDALRWAGIAVIAALPPLAAFLVTRSPRLLRLVERFPRHIAASLNLPVKIDGGSLEEAVRAIYQHRRALAATFFAHVVGWVLAAVETWIALHFMEKPVDLADAITLESLVFAIRGAIFFVPLSAGVQEGGYVLVGAMFGIAPEHALALSLIKRARDLILGIPAVIAWQAIEGRQLHRRARARASTRERAAREAVRP